MNTGISVRAYGKVGGEQWMGGKGTSQFDYKFTRKPGVPFEEQYIGSRSLFSFICNRYGDFQNPLIVEGTLVLTYHKGNRTVIKEFNMRDSKDAQDYVMPEEESENYFFE